MVQVRQGDLLLEQVGEVAAEAEPVPHRGRPAHVLARGERTGHAHRVVAGPGVSLLRSPPRDREGLTIGYLALERAASLEHEEHRPVRLDPGVWRVRRQRRWDPAADGWAPAGD
jgi:hypothetical protein